MTTKYNIGDTILIPYRITGIRIDKTGVSYIINVDPIQVDDQLTYFLDTSANISERNMERLIEREI